MAVNLLRCILLCLFSVNVVQAGTPWTPSVEYLPPERLEPLLRDLDKATSSSDFYVRDRQLLSIMGMIPNGERFSGAFYCRFSNPEIIDRVVDLYRREAARELAGELPPTEGGAEYLMALAEVAESTFDPRLYEDILRKKTTFSGGFRSFYLATVEPERTLDYLFEIEIGKKGTGWDSRIRKSFVILSYMTVESPQVLRADWKRSITFVAQHARRFAGPIKRYSRPPKYLYGHDYYVRSDALDVLELVGTVTDVPLVEEIIHDAKEVDFRNIRGGFGRRLDTYLDRGYEQIQDKGQRIIEILRQRSPSWR